MNISQINVQSIIENGRSVAQLQTKNGLSTYIYLQAGGGKQQSEKESILPW